MDKFNYIESHLSANGFRVMNAPYPIYMNAGGAGCKAKCDVLYGDLAKAKCHTQYIKQPCGWDCSKSENAGKKCCQHNKQVPINIANCKRNVDARRASCKADCDAKANTGSGDGGIGVGEPVPVDMPTNEVPDKDVDSGSGNNGGSGSGDSSSGAKEVDGKKILLYTGVAIGAIAGISLLVWGVTSMVAGNKVAK